MKIEIKKDVIFSNGEVLGTLTADKIARANGFIYAERFIKEYAEKKLILNTNLKIINVDDYKN